MFSSVVNTCLSIRNWSMFTEKDTPSSSINIQLIDLPSAIVDTPSHRSSEQVEPSLTDVSQERLSVTEVSGITFIFLAMVACKLSMPNPCLQDQPTYTNNFAMGGSIIIHNLFITAFSSIVVTCLESITQYYDAMAPEYPFPPDYLTALNYPPAYQTNELEYVTIHTPPSYHARTA